MTGRCRSGRMIISMLAPLELDILQAGYAMTDNSEVSRCLLASLASGHGIIKIHYKSA